MSELFDDDDHLVEDPFDADEKLTDKLTIDASEATILDARRRLEKRLEEKRLRDELDDFSDYE
ncbi:PA3496 family putative envelope integrity protein [Legionella sp. CNM-4043-24]|uniref:PA3496 family putative envelope integrity protein n=1 Tax=Legionella sp. CNM-4043-24 TaxID=3421646 RepID=UPI00403ACCCE